MAERKTEREQTKELRAELSDAQSVAAEATEEAARLAEQVQAKAVEHAAETGRLQEELAELRAAQSEAAKAKEVEAARVAEDVAKSAAEGGTEDEEAASRATASGASPAEADPPPAEGSGGVVDVEAEAAALADPHRNRSWSDTIAAYSNSDPSIQATVSEAQLAWATKVQQLHGSGTEKVLLEQVLHQLPRGRERGRDRRFWLRRPAARVVKCEFGFFGSDFQQRQNARSVIC
jgi:hypothetical protein